MEVSRFFLLTAFIASIKCAPTVETINDDVSIVGGVEVVPHSLPYQVGLIMDTIYFCGGVLIGAQYILTAAHCVYGRTKIDAVLGAHDISIDEGTQKIFTDCIMIIHGNYTNSTYSNDIALVKLNGYVQFTNAILPIAHLADAGSGSFCGSNAILSGWGYVSTGSTTSESNLRKVGLTIMSNNDCEVELNENGADMHESELCTNGEDLVLGTVGACFGDSGGPLVVNHILVGLVSFGSSDCENGYPTVYTRISSYRSWISKYSGV